MMRIDLRGTLKQFDIFLAGNSQALIFTGRLMVKHYF